MKRILLDTNIIIKYPKLLGIKKRDTVFVITTAIMNELVLKTKFNSGLSDLIQQADVAGNIEILLSSSPDIRFYESNVPAFGLSGADQNLLAAALYYKRHGDNVSISSNDKYIKLHATTLNIPLTDDQQIQNFIKFDKKKDTDAALVIKIEKFEFKISRRLLLQIFTATAAIEQVRVFELFKEPILNHVNIWGIILFFFILGIGLFIIRERWRLTYGVFEFFFGFATIVYIFWPVFDYLKIKELEVDIKLVGGLYIMVRGQDNIVKALKGTKPGVFLAEKLRIGL